MMYHIPTKKRLICPPRGRLEQLIAGIVMLAVAGCHGLLRQTPTGKPDAVFSTPHVSVQQLIDDAEDNELIHVPSGRYVLSKGLLVENRKDLRIVFEKGASILVDDVTLNVISIVGSENISVENVKLAHLKPRETYACHGNVVDIRDSRNVKILRCDISGCGAVGVMVRGTEGLLLDGCHVHRNTFNALYLHGSRGVRIERNVIEHNANFLQLYDVDDFRMSHNVIRNNGGYW